jgi:hypothetical protein
MLVERLGSAMSDQALMHNYVLPASDFQLEGW